MNIFCPSGCEAPGLLHELPDGLSQTPIQTVGVRRGREEFPLEISVATSETATDHYYGIIARDITSRLRTEQELLVHRELVEATLQSMIDGVIVTDGSCNVTRMNEAAERLTGRSGPAGIGMPLADVLPAELPLPVDEMLAVWACNSPIVAHITGNKNRSR